MKNIDLEECERDVMWLFETTFRHNRNGFLNDSERQNFSIKLNDVGNDVITCVVKFYDDIVTHTNLKLLEEDDTPISFYIFLNIMLKYKGNNGENFNILENARITRALKQL
jgi:hypothetical protein